MTDIASAAAAVAAGYTKTQTDRGVGSASPRFLTTFTKMVVGASEQSHVELRAVGVSDVSAAAADTQAVTCLNGMRNIRYGTGATAGTDQHGKQHTFDAS